MMYCKHNDEDVAWALKTYGEIKSIGENDGSLLIVPVGSIEQHGDHLPVSTDTLLADAVAHKGATRVKENLPVAVTPTVWSGLSSHHLPFGGTLSIEFETMLDMVSSVAQTALDNEFDAILLLNGHGGNMSLISTVLDKIGRNYPSVEVYGLTYFYLAADVIDDVRDSESGGMMHGGELETSLMLHLYPELVEENEMTAVYSEPKHDYMLEDLFGSGSLGSYSTFADHTDTGIMGDPTLASKEKGKKIFEYVGEELELLLTDIHDEASN